MTPAALLAAVAAGAFALSCAGTRMLVSLLRRGAVLDHPNPRSSHVAPTPRGGGIAVVTAITIAWVGLWAGGVLPVESLAIVLGAVVLGAIGWLDDLRGLSPALRLLVQFAVVA